MAKPGLFEDLRARTLVNQMTDPGLPQLLDRESFTLYAGFDPTSDSLHVGSLLPLLTMRRFQNYGHKPIAVVGGATGMIGDPSGKSAERTLMTSELIEHNLAGIRKVISRFLVAEGTKEGLLVDNPARILNNADWFKGVSYIQFLRDVGKHFTVNHMIAKESVRARLEDREHGISYTEFSYMLLQAYDFYVLAEDHKCRLQIGGSDQWGNITAGIELIRRMRAAEQGDPELREVPVYGLTHPLVTKSDGTKFGKTESGAIWLDAAKTSPYRFYQFFVGTADADVGTYLRYFTFLPIEEILRLDAQVTQAPEKREAQKTLAREVTKLVHGEDELARAEKATQALFGESLRELDERTLLDVMVGAPTTRKARDVLGGAGLSLIDALVDTGLCPSKGAARKEITAGGIYVNNERIADAAAVLLAKDQIAGSYVVLRKGKKNYHLVAFA